MRFPTLPEVTMLSSCQDPKLRAKQFAGHASCMSNTAAEALSAGVYAGSLEVSEQA